MTEVRERLYEWGREYCFDRDREPNAKNYLYDLIRFRGRIPKATGTHGPRERTAADEIEDIVKSLFLRDAESAICLRINYCGRGPLRDKANEAGLSIRMFKMALQRGREFVTDTLAGQ